MISLREALVQKTNQVVTLQTEVEDLRTKLIISKSEVEEASQELEQKIMSSIDEHQQANMKIKEIDQELQNKDIKIAAMEQEMGAKNKEVQDKDIKIAAMERELEARNKEVQDKDIKIAEMEQELGDKKKELQDKETNDGYRLSKLEQFVSTVSGFVKEWETSSISPSLFPTTNYPLPSPSPMPMPLPLSLSIPMPFSTSSDPFADLGGGMSPTYETSLFNYPISSPLPAPTTPLSTTTSGIVLPQLNNLTPNRPTPTMTNKRLPDVVLESKKVKRRRFKKDLKKQCEPIINSTKWSKKIAGPCHVCPHEDDVMSKKPQLHTECSTCQSVFCHRCIYYIAKKEDKFDVPPQLRLSNLDQCPKCQKRCTCKNCVDSTTAPLPSPSPLPFTSLTPIITPPSLPVPL